MIIVNKAYRYRLYPTIEQKIMFAKTFGCARFIYNKMLGDRRLKGEYLPSVTHKVPWVARESTPVERV